jgi:hypothetical protein
MRPIGKWVVPTTQKKAIKAAVPRSQDAPKMKTVFFLLVSVFSLSGIACVRPSQKESETPISQKIETSPEKKAPVQTEKRRQVAPSEVLRRAGRAAEQASTALVEFQGQPSFYALGAACRAVGLLEGYLVVVAYQWNDKLLETHPDIPQGATGQDSSSLFSDVAQWASLPGKVGPLCDRRGSSWEDFLEDLESVKSNLNVLKSTLKTLRAVQS